MLQNDSDGNKLYGDRFTSYNRAHVRSRPRTTSGKRLRRLIIVAVLVIVIAAAYRLPQEPETTGTGALTLNQPWPTLGEKVPSFEAEGLNGERFEAPDEGTYVLTFWSGLNRASHDAHSEFEQLAREYGDSEVSFAAVYVGSVPREDRSDAPYSVIKDDSGELTSMYNVKRVPRLFLVKNGTVRLAQDSFYGEQEREMRRELDSTIQASN